MKLPSIPYLAKVTTEVVRRFPLVALISITGVVAAMILTEVYSFPENVLPGKILMTALLALPLFLSAAIAAEKWKLEGLKKWIPSLVTAALALAWFLTLRLGEYGPGTATVIRFAGLVLAAHLLVAFIAHLGRSSIADFWEYNKQLFANFMIGVFYSMVLFSGLGFAILAVDNLFNANINSNVYMHLFILIAGLFNTVYFLANFPKKFAFSQDTGNEAGASSSPYTPAIRQLTRFVLIPVVIIYFLILYAFSIKILIAWELPKGWVGSLVLGFSVAGIFTYLLNYLLVKYDSAALIAHFRKWFFIVLFPMVGLLFVAIGKRISDFGVTESRFIVAASGVWLLLVCLYFIISKKDDIRVIPISLCTIALLAVLGPISAFQVSARSQAKRLEAVLTKNNMLSEGKAIPPGDTISAADANDIRSIMDYLRRYEHFGEVAGWFGAPAGETPDWKDIDKFIGELQIGHETATLYCYASFPTGGAIEPGDFEKIFMISADQNHNSSDSFRFTVSDDKRGLDLFENGKKADHFDLEPYLTAIAKKYDCNSNQYEWEDADYQTEGAVYTIRLVTRDMEFNKGKDIQLSYWNGLALLK